MTTVPRDDSAAAGAASMDSVDPAIVRQAGYWLFMTRAVEDAGRNLYLQGRIPGSFYGGRGQEATAVGVGLAMAKDDIACPHIRDMGLHLVRGVPAASILMHYMGKEGGPLRGRDGSVHIGDLSKGTLPMVSHLPESLPVGLGVALGRRMRGAASAAIGLSGEGASSAGCWHETLNLAGLWKIPFVLIVERNGWSYMTPADRLLPVDRLSDRASGYGGMGRVVDGNDVLAVYYAVVVARAAACAGQTPFIVESFTYRMHGHGAHDAAKYVPESELQHWAERDPLMIWQERAADVIGWTSTDQDELQERVGREIAAALDVANESLLPTPDDLEADVFANS